MKFFLALFALVAVANVQGRPDGYDHHHRHFSQNVTELIHEYGYPVQNFTVETEDGYYLDVIRVPGGADYKQAFERKQRKEQDDGVSTGKPAVILMHGLLSSAEDFVFGGPSQGLAFVLADHGYDVFLANARGNYYARKHTTLNPDKDAAFWRFCWHDIGKKDLPAIIDEVLKITEQRKVYYVGHMQGNTVFYVMASERPEYNDKVEKVVALGPVAYLKGASNLMLKSIADHQDSKAWQMKSIGTNEFHPSNAFLEEAGGQDCASHGISERICQNPYFLIKGYESDKLNMTTMEKYAQRLPAGASVRQVLHYSQLLKSGRFEKYSESDEQTEEYDLSRVTVPVAMFYAPSDSVSSQEDVSTLKQHLPNVAEYVKLSQCYNNLDLLFGKQVNSVVYNHVIEALKAH